MLQTVLGCRPFRSEVNDCPLLGQCVGRVVSNLFVRMLRDFQNGPRARPRHVMLYVLLPVCMEPPTRVIRNSNDV